MAPAIFLDGPPIPPVRRKGYVGLGRRHHRADMLPAQTPSRCAFYIAGRIDVQAWLKRIAAVFIEKTVKPETFLISEAHIRRSALVRRRAPVRAPPCRTIPLTYLNNYARLSRS
jgi:hypothetical protein